jgi:hypothetical protein
MPAAMHRVWSYCSEAGPNPTRQQRLALATDIDGLDRYSRPTRRVPCGVNRPPQQLQPGCGRANVLYDALRVWKVTRVSSTTE